MFNKFGIATLILALGVCLSIPAFGQNASPWDINGDVDGDGIVGTTDIQHVINGALGLGDHGPDAVRSFVRQYIVASPRASLMPVPQLQGSDPETDRCTVAGAAFNFPRDEGRILIRTGGTVIFRFDRNAEGVIYPGACGGLRSELLIEARRLVRPVEEEGEGEMDPVEPDENVDKGEDEVDDPNEPEWVEIGFDAVEGRGCGPQIGAGNVAVRAHFEHAGAFLIRATIRTYAIPANEDGELSETDEDFCGAARSVSEVFVGVRVVPADVDPRDLDWEHEGRVDSVPEVFGRPFDHEIDATMPLP